MKNVILSNKLATSGFVTHSSDSALIDSQTTSFFIPYISPLHKNITTDVF